MNFVISLKQTKTKTAKQERSIDVQTLSTGNSLNETTKVVMLPAFHYLLFITKLIQLPTDHKRPYLAIEELFFIVEIGNILK